MRRDEVKSGPPEMHQAFDGDTASRAMTEVAGWSLPIPYDEVIQAIVRSVPEPDSGAITSIGIPTSNRIDCLRRCVESLLTSCIRSGRPIELTVASDASGVGRREAHEKLLRTLSVRHDVRISYMTRERRAAYAQVLAREAGVHEDIVRFALLGRPQIGPTFGAARNALMLQTFGSRMLQIDDDVFFPSLSVRNVKRGVRLSSRDTPETYWFDVDEDTRAEEGPAIRRPASDGPLGHHEALLGKAAAGCVARAIESGQPVDLNEMRPALFARICGGARVAVTYLGTTGDSGMQYHLPRLFLKGDSLDHLVRERFEQRLRSRRVMRSVTQQTLSDGAACMTTNIGLDLRHYVPPFMPVLRNEDGILGLLLSRVCRTNVAGFMPHMLQHEPPSSRGPFDGDIVGDWLDRRSNNVLMWLISSAVPHAEGASDAARVASVGGQIADYASTSLEAFADRLHQAEIIVLEDEIERARECLEDAQELPSAWQDAVSGFIAGASMRLAEPQGRILSDLSGNREQRVATFKDLVARYGGLLACWSDVLEAASVLHDRGMYPANGL